MRQSFVVKKPRECCSSFLKAKKACKLVREKQLKCSGNE